MAFEGGAYGACDLLYRANNVGRASTAATTPADVTALLATLAASSIVPLAFYDVRYGLVQSGGVVSAWNDVRGPGYANYAAVQRTAAGSLQPAWDGTTVNYDGVDDNLSTGFIALFDPSIQNLTLAWGGSVAGAAGKHACILRNGALTRYLGIDSDGTNIQFKGNDGTTNSSPSTAVAVGSTLRATFYQNQNSARQFQGQVHAAAVDTRLPAGAFVSESFAYCGGAQGPAGANAAPVKERWSMILPANLAQGTRDTIAAWSVTNHATVTA